MLGHFVNHRHSQNADERQAFFVNAVWKLLGRQREFGHPLIRLCKNLRLTQTSIMQKQQSEGDTETSKATVQTGSAIQAVARVRPRLAVSHVLDPILGRGDTDCP